MESGKGGWKNGYGNGREECPFYIDLAWEKDPHIRSFRLGLEEVLKGKYLETLYVPVQGQAFLLVGW